jgi:hypothetical protein
VTFGLFVADAGTVIAGGSHLAGAGLVLSFIGWFVCAAGSAVAFLIRPDRTAGPAGASGPLVPLARPRGAALGPALLLVLAGLGAAAAFAPAWDSFTLRTAAGQTQTFTAGNAFADPGPVIVGNVIVMVTLAAVVVVAALWRPARYGAVLLAGAVIPMAAQAISALVQVGQATSPTQFGFTPTQASQLGLTISAGLTPAFWIYCVFVVVLVVSCAWMLFTPQEAAVLAGAGTGLRSDDEADTQVPTWHVARAEAYDAADARSRVLDDNDRDTDEDADSDEFDSYEEFASDSPGDSTVTSETHGEEPGRHA